MDFAFVPGVTAYEDLLRRVMKARPKTTLITKAGITSIAGFLHELESQSLQADDLIVGAHASRRTFAIKFDDVTAQPTLSNGKDYEMLKAVDTAGTMHIPAPVRKPNTSFHLKGCQIGSQQSQPFLRLFKTALDSPKTLTAPKYPHVLANDAGRGVFEYMRYSYEVMNPTAFKTVSELVSAFKNGNFTQGVKAGGTPVPVPDENWDKWVQSTLDLNPAISHEVKFNFPVKLVPKVGKKTFMASKTASCTSDAENITFAIDMTGRTIPADEPGRMALLKPALLSDSRLQLGHPFPLYVRLGFADFDSFFKGLTWTVSLEGNRLVYVGSHFVYGLEIPVVKDTNTLIFNYYPASAANGPPVVNFLENNAAFELFGIA